MGCVTLPARRRSRRLRESGGGKGTKGSGGWRMRVGPAGTSDRVGRQARDARSVPDRVAQRNRPRSAGEGDGRLGRIPRREGCEDETRRERKFVRTRVYPVYAFYLRSILRRVRNAPGLTSTESPRHAGSYRTDYRLYICSCANRRSYRKCGRLCIFFLKFSGLRV